MTQSPSNEGVCRTWFAGAVRWTCLLVLGASGVQAHLLTGADVATLAQLTVDERLVGGTYEVQYGELAAFDQRQRMDQDRDGRLAAGEVARYVEEMGRQLNSHLVLEIDGEALPVHLEAGQVLSPDSLVAPSQMTLRFRVRSEPSDFTRPRRLRFRDENQMPRLVHSDISVEGLPLVDLDQALVDPGAGFLKQVRVQAVKAPVEARLLLKPSETVWQSGPAATQGLGSEAQAAPRQASASGTERLKDVLRNRALSPGLILFAVLLALFLGGVHALEPGHGKTIVAAYLVGSRGTVAQAAFLGGVVTSTHTFSVILLGLITLFASQYILPEQIFPWLGFGSGMLIVGVGIWLFVRALVRPADHGHSHDSLGHHHVAPVPDHEHEHGHDHPHDHDHEHGHGDDHGHVHAHEHGHDHPHDHGHEEARDHAHPHEHGHSHLPQGEVSLGSLMALGISGGLVPCPGALVILLLAVALHRIAFGMMLILAFSLGLAAVLITIGVLMVKARPLMERFSGEGKWVRRLPLISSVVITAVGLVMGIRSLMEAGIVIIRL